MEEAKQVLKERAPWTISFVQRESNAAADTLAKHSLVLLEESISIEEVPNVIVDIVQNDISNQ